MIFVILQIMSLMTWHTPYGKWTPLTVTVNRSFIEVDVSTLEENPRSWAVAVVLRKSFK